MDDPETNLRTIDDLHRLYKAEHSALLRLARLITGSSMLAEEAVHDAFITVYQRRRSVDRPGAYLKRVVVNNCRSVMRRQAVERKKIETVGLTGSNDVMLPPELEEVWDTLGRLKPKQRTALVLRYYEDLALQDVADVMGERLGTVKSLIHRALNQLRTTLDDDHPELRPSVLGGRAASRSSDRNADARSGRTSNQKDAT